MRNKLVRLLAITLLMVVGSHTRAALILNIDSTGQLTGASNVLINQQLYNVEFLDDSCQALFDGCDDVNDFSFQNFADAQAAGFALLEQVFVDSTEGMFATQPADIFGCNASFGCSALVPYALANIDDVIRVSAETTRNVGIQTLGVGTTFTSLSTVNRSGEVYALFELADISITEVSEPSAIAIFALGLMGLSARRFKKIVNR